MIDLGISKLALIGAVALIVIGPEKLPRVARTVGALLGKAQRYVADVKAEVNRSMDLEELKRMKDSVESAARDVQSSMQSHCQTILRSHGLRPRPGWITDYDAWVVIGSERRPGLQTPEKELAHQAKGHAPVVQGPHWRAHPYPVGCGPCGALPPPLLFLDALMSDSKDSADELAGTEQPFVQHLMELRNRLMYGMAGLARVHGIAGVLAGSQRSDRLDCRADSRPHATRCQADRGGRFFAFLHSLEGAGDDGAGAFVAVVDVPDLGFCGARALRPRKALCHSADRSGQLAGLHGHRALSSFLCWTRCLGSSSSSRPRAWRPPPTLPRMSRPSLSLYLAFGLAFPGADCRGVARSR